MCPPYGAGHSVPLYSYKEALNKPKVVYLTLGSLNMFPILRSAIQGHNQHLGMRMKLTVHLYKHGDILPHRYDIKRCILTQLTSLHATLQWACKGVINLEPDDCRKNHMELTLV